MVQSVEKSLQDILQEFHRIIGLPPIAGGSQPPSAEWSLQNIYEAVANWSPSGGDNFDPEAIASDLLPDADEIYSVGSAAKRWAYGYFANALLIGDGVGHGWVMDAASSLTFVTALEVTAFQWLEGVLTITEDADAVAVLDSVAGKLSLETEVSATEYAKHHVTIQDAAGAEVFGVDATGALTHDLLPAVPDLTVGAGGSRWGSGFFQDSVNIGAATPGDNIQLTALAITLLTGAGPDELFALSNTQLRFTSSPALQLTEYAIDHLSIQDAAGDPIATISASAFGVFGEDAAQAAHIVDPTDEAENSAAIAAILDALEAYGLLAAS